MNYTAPLTEALIPAIWDLSYVYGMPRTSAVPDPTMPRGSRNLAQGNTLYAHLADIRTGWQRASLTLKERRALLLRFGLDWTEQRIAEHEGCHQQNVSLRLRNGVSKVTAVMNGQSVQLGGDGSLPTSMV